MFKKINKAGSDLVQTPKSVLKWAPAAALMLLTLSACGEKAKHQGQSLASVDGDEITVMQLNEELQRANIPQQAQQSASKQLLESLIERQLLTGAAVKEKLDRDPKVVQSIERAKAMILAQAYLQKHVPQATKPSAAEVADYYAKNPSFFANNKIFEMRQLILASKDLVGDLKTVIDGAKSLDEVASWLDSHQVKYARGQLARASAELPPELSSKLLEMAKGQLFIVREGERTVISVVMDIKDRPVSQEAATPQIEQFLAAQKNREAMTAEVARLRSAAKIEYLNKQATDGEAASSSAKSASAAGASAATAASEQAKPLGSESTERGVAGLK